MSVAANTRIFEETQNTRGPVPWVAETAIPNKHRELLGVAVSGVSRCGYCALFHSASARLYGATDQEIAEAGYMGAVTMLASSFMNAAELDYDRFRRETLDIVKHVRRHAHV